MFSLDQVLASHSHSVTDFTRKKDQKHFRQQQKSGNSAKISALLLLNKDIHLEHQLRDYIKTLKFLDLWLSFSLTLLWSLLWPNFPHIYEEYFSREGSTPWNTRRSLQRVNQHSTLKIFSLKSASAGDQTFCTIIYLLTPLESWTNRDSSCKTSPQKQMQFCSGFHDFTRKTLSIYSQFSWAEYSSHKLVDKIISELLLACWQQLT